MSDNQGGTQSGRRTLVWLGVVVVVALIVLLVLVGSGFVFGFSLVWLIIRTPVELFRSLFTLGLL